MAGAGARPPTGRCPRRAGRTSICTPIAASATVAADRGGRRSITSSIRATRYRRIGGAISSGEPVMRAGAYRPARSAFRREPRRSPTCWSSRRRRSTRDLEVVGPVTARLWIASDAPDTDFTAKLIDLYPPSADYPDGFAMNLTEGLLRVRYRDSWEQPAPMAPGEVYAITIELFPIGKPVPPRPPAAARHCEQQLPAFRRQPEFGRAGRLDGCIRAPPATASSRLPSAPRTSCCRSFPRKRPPTGRDRTAAGRLKLFGARVAGRIVAADGKTGR